MKAVMLTGLNEMELRDVPQPTIRKPDEVLIKVSCVGVCGSDVHYYTTGRIGSQIVEYPFIVGHECAGIIEKTGSNVKNLKAGDRVAIDPAMPCFNCDQCKVGRMHTCKNLRFLGTPGQGGGSLCEYLVMPASSCYKISNTMTMEEAALSEPLSIGLYAVKLFGDIEGKNIGIFGVGPIGLSVLLCARAFKVGKIYITDILDERLKFAEQFSPDSTLNPEKSDIVKVISKEEPLLLDGIFECCGQQSAVYQAVDLLKPGGKLVIVGIPPTLENWSFPVDKLRRKEICIQNVRRQNECVQPALDMIERKDVNVAKMVTHRFPFEKTKEAFDIVAEYRDGVIKAMINIS